MDYDREWEANEASRDWEESEKRYPSNSCWQEEMRDEILLTLTKEQHARLRELYRAKNAWKCKKNPMLVLGFAIDAVMANNAYEEFVSNWPGLIDVYDGV
jgi:hypothetical protein